MIEKGLKKIFTRNQNTPMSETQYAMLQACAKTNNVSCADVVRAAVNMYLETHGNKQ